mmetsp:Transcript_19772/g.49006  ORF Transcript_19772/g.49006 Transcript_19772/m.49006 type:complete len:214 (+) Transcript_19772:328-969(+)
MLYCVGRLRITPMLPLSWCSRRRMTDWWKYCWPCLNSSSDARSRQPLSGAPITCAHAFSEANFGFCRWSNSMFSLGASLVESSSRDVEVSGPASWLTSIARKSRQSPSSAGATSSSVGGRAEEEALFFFVFSSSFCFSSSSSSAAGAEAAASPLSPASPASPSLLLLGDAPRGSPSPSTPPSSPSLPSSIPPAPGWSSAVDDACMATETSRRV